MADVSIRYKNSEIGTLSASGSKIINTAGKYCEDNLTVIYDKPTPVITTGTLTLSISAGTWAGMTFEVCYPTVSNGSLILTRNTSGTYGVPLTVETCYFASASDWHGTGQYVFVDCTDATTPIDITVNSSTNAHAWVFNDGPRKGCIMIQVYGPNASISLTANKGSEIEDASGVSF